MKTNKPGFSFGNSSGITVLEFLIILTALAIVILVSVPGSTVLLSNYRISTASKDLVSGLNSARYEALRRHSTVRVCPSSNGRFCRRDGDWSQGWLIYTDGNADNVVQDIELIASHGAPNQNIRIIADGAVRTAASFHVSGLASDHDEQQGNFMVCHLGSNAKANQISVGEDGWVELNPLTERGCEQVF